MEFGRSEPTAPAAVEMKSTAHGASLRPEDLGTGTHELPARVISLRRDLTTLRHRTIHDPIAVVPPDLLIVAIRRRRRYFPGGIILRAVKRVSALIVHVVLGRIDVRKGGSIPE